jgi:hypothetical protein
MKKSDEPEMRAEYDFSSGQRSRYASRFTDADRREILARSASFDAQFQLAYALRQVQELEGVVVAALVLIFHQTQESAGRQAASLLEGHDRSMLSRLSSGTRHEETFVARFQKLMNERSWLVHKGGFGLGAPPSEPNDLAALVARLEALGKEAAGLSSDLTSALRQRLAEAGLTPQEVDRQTRDAIHRWLAA